MNVPEFAVRRSVTIFMIIVGLLVLGFVALSRLAIDLFPEMNLPVAVVIAEYPGAGPQEIEKSVTKPLEEVLATLNNVDTLNSQSSTGSSVIILMFNWGTDMDFATLQMREKIDMIKGILPEDVNSPMVMKMDPAMMPIVQVGISGGRDLAELTRLAEDVVKPRLERLPGAAWVTITGGRTREVHVLVDPVKLNEYGLSLSQVTQTLRSENIELSAGTLGQGKKDLLIRTSGEFEDLTQLANTPLTTPSGTVVYLKDISEVKQGFVDITQETRMNGHPSVGVHIQKQSGSNTVNVAQAINEELENMKKDLPGNVEINAIIDQSEYIRDSIRSVVENALIGSLLAVLIIFLFLRNMRSTLVIALSIPISIIATFILVYFAGISLNMLSLGGLALGVGMIVDDSIVVLESIFRWRQAGHSRWEAATAGAQEVAMAVTASTLTNVIIFLPIVFVQGIASQVFRDMAFTVTFSLLASLFVALTLVPVLAYRLVKVIPEQKTPHTLYERANAAVGRFMDAMHELYRELLVWALRSRKKVILGTVAIFLFSLALAPLIGAEFFPKMDSGEMAISIKMPRGTGLNETGKAVDRVEAICASMKEVSTTFVSVGSAGGMEMAGGSGESDQARISVKLVPESERKLSTGQVVTKLRQQVTAIPGAEIEISETDAVMMGMNTGSPITINLKGDDLGVLKTTAEAIAGEVRQVPGTSNVKTTLEEGKPEVNVILDRDRASAYGIGTTQVAQTLRTAVEGQVVTKYRTGGEELNLRLRLAPETRQSLEDLGSLSILSPTGVAVPLREIANLQKTESPVRIEREGQTRICQITGDLDGQPLSTVMKNIQARLDKFQLPRDYEITYGGEQEQMMESFGALIFALLLGILLVYMVMASQFESLFHPFVIMFTMPLAFIGVVWAFILTGMTFSIVSFIGIIMLAGIVVKNGIVLVDYINTLRRRGLPRQEAILQAGPIRLRPVLMTALAAILGMVPLALGFGEGNEAVAPLAIAVIGGLIVATFLTLVVIPVIYTLFEDLGGNIQNRYRSLNPATAPGQEQNTGL